jgi:uncharacterized protein
MWGTDMKVTSSFLTRALLSLCMLLCLPLQFASADKFTRNYEEKRREANDIAVSIVVSGLSCTCARFAEDIRNVVNDLRPDGIRVLPVLGVGGLQNAEDVLFLKNVDMGVVDEDNLRLLEKRDPKLYAGIEQNIQYITKLYNSEFHILARKDIKTYDDLRGKAVSFNLKDSQTEVSADAIFEALKIDVKKVNYDNDEALEKLRNGEIAAMIILTGAPQALLAKVTKQDQVHFLALDRDSLPNHDLSEIFAHYLPAELTHEHYPNLIPEGTTVPTIANRALLVAYNWPVGSPRYRRVAKFVDAFFSKIDEFHTAARHPKWKEVNLAAEIPGWTRFKPAADWLAAHQGPPAQQAKNSADQAGAVAASSPEDNPDLKQAFERFMATYATQPGHRALTANERAILYARFMQYVAAQKPDSASR